MIDLLWLLLFPVVVAAGFAGLLVQFRPAWSVRRTIVSAALPLPGLMIAICLWLFISAATASKESCGVDACGMAMMFSTFGMGYALAAFTLGVLAAAWIKRSAMRR